MPENVFEMTILILLDEPRVHKTTMTMITMTLTSAEHIFNPNPCDSVKS